MEIHEAQTEPVCEMHQGSQRLNAPVTDPDHAWGIWGRKASGVLLVCGRGIDALDVPFRVIELLLALADADLTVPVATAPAPSRWVLFVATGSGTLRDDLTTASVRLRGTGQWVALPPTAVVGCPPLRWRIPPLDDGAPAPAGAEEVQRVLAEALRSGTSHADRG